MYLMRSPAYEKGKIVRLSRKVYALETKRSKRRFILKSIPSQWAAFSTKLATIYNRIFETAAGY